MAHGKICYLEIPAKTAQASADFYSWATSSVYARNRIDLRILSDEHCG